MSEREIEAAIWRQAAEIAEAGAERWKAESANLKHGTPAFNFVLGRMKQAESSAAAYRAKAEG